MDLAYFSSSRAVGTRVGQSVNNHAAVHAECCAGYHLLKECQNSVVWSQCLVLKCKNS